MFKHFTHYLLMPLALFIFISQSAFSAGLITNSKLKEWIKANTDQLSGVAVNSDGGIDNTTANLEALAKINELDCSKAGLTIIDELIRHMSGLEQLDCSDNPLTGLDVSNNINLKRLYCWRNQLASLDLSNNKKLEELCCPENQLTSLSVSNITGITYLYCMENQLTNLSLNNTTALVCLMCSGNQISSLDVSTNNKLEELYCDDNILSELDISSLSSLEGLNCCNQATGFTVYLTEEQKNKFTTQNYCDAILSTDPPLPNQLIKDQKLKEWIKANKDKLPGVDINEDGGIDSTTANLEALAKINKLHCNKAELTTINELIRHMPGLGTLDCSDNQLAVLDVSLTVNLEDLKCSGNQLTELDISKSTELKELDCSNNQLTELDVTTNTKLESLDCSYNDLLHLSGGAWSTRTRSIDCSNNKITNLDVSNSTELEKLDCSGNKLTSLKISDKKTNKTNLSISSNTELKELDCSNNQLTELDVSDNTGLEKFRCNDNILDNLDISPLSDLVELQCCNQAQGFILYLTEEQKNKFTEEDYCDAILNAVSNDLITNSKLKEWIKAHTDQLPGVVINEDGGINNTTANLEALAKINMLRCVQSPSLTSIDELIRNMSNLRTLICGMNSLINLDISNNINLITLNCSGNQLSNLDITKNINLEELYCDTNQLSNLDVSKNTRLKNLACSNNQLTNIDLSKNTELESLLCYSNQLTNLDLSKNINLKLLVCSENQLSNLDVSKNIKLEDLHCNDNILDSLDIRLLTNLERLSCCNQAQGFTLYLTKEQKNIFNEEDYCDAILKEKDGSICEIEWLDIYPNPTTGKFFIESKFLSDEIKILNLAGEVLYKNTLNAEKTEIDISNLPAGMYIVKTKGKIGKVIKN